MVTDGFLTVLNGVKMELEMEFFTASLPLLPQLETKHKETKFLFKADKTKNPKVIYILIPDRYFSKREAQII